MTALKLQLIEPQKNTETDGKQLPSRGAAEKGDGI